MHKGPQGFLASFTHDKIFKLCDCDCESVLGQDSLKTHTYCCHVRIVLGHIGVKTKYLFSVFT